MRLTRGAIPWCKLSGLAPFNKYQPKSLTGRCVGCGDKIAKFRRVVGFASPSEHQQFIYAADDLLSHEGGARRELFVEAL
jgi:hypothetical protein